MTLKEKIKNDSITARKNKKEIEYSTLNYLLALILNKEKEKRFKIIKKENSVEDIEKKSQLTDDEIIDLILSEIKKRKESLEFFQKEKRDELIKKEEEELKILEKYIPQQLTDNEIEEIVKEVIDKNKIDSLKDMGKIMGNVMPKIKGRADGSKVSNIVKKIILEKINKPE
ncbi:MAG: GatB/YqeY domain-containing protein [Candidatus Pacebacteria bacterium]|nr:GatB/YqeY domain-containing protein [Candidatus Paceibacterota bacterium]